MLRPKLRVSNFFRDIYLFFDSPDGRSFGLRHRRLRGRTRNDLGAEPETTSCSKTSVRVGTGSGVRGSEDVLRDVGTSLLPDPPVSPRPPRESLSVLPTPL